MIESSAPFLLDFLEPVDPAPAPENLYDRFNQRSASQPLTGATQRTQSFQNRTSGYSAITAYEDSDDEYVTRSD